MPCDIGVRSYAKIEIPAPEPQVFAEKVEAPNIDADLLEKLGVEDPEFLSWVSELGVRPLLAEALTRAQSKVPTGALNFTINAKGMLEAKGSFTSANEKAKLTQAASAVSERWQFEILGIVADLLNYDVEITTKSKVMVLEASERGKEHPCNYIKITRSGGVSDITFEHFKTRKSLDLEVAKFLALTHKLGVQIAIRKQEVVEGDPFPEEVRHTHAHSHAHRHGEDHEH
jgi:hypothetical protein